MKPNNRSPLHRKWHRRVEGQIRDVLHAHPRWFTFYDKSDEAMFVQSLAKRIVGEIVAAAKVGGDAGGADSHLASFEANGAGCITGSMRAGAGFNLAPARQRRDFLTLRKEHDDGPERSGARG